MAENENLTALLKEQREAYAAAEEARKKDNQEMLQKATAAYAEAKKSADKAAEEQARTNAQLEQLAADVKQLAGSGSVHTATAAKDEKLRSAFASMLRSYDQNHPVPGEVRAALTEGTDANGGYLVIPEYDKEIGTIVAGENPFRKIATVKTISSDTYKKNVRKSGITAVWGDESDDASDDVGGTFAQVEIPVNKVSAMVPVSIDLVEDQAYDLAGALNAEAGRVFAAAERLAMTSGNGTKKPLGFLSETTVADGSWEWGKVGFIVSGAAAALGTAADNLIDLTRTLKSEYRANGKFMGNNNTFANLLKLKKGSGGANDYLIWQPSFVPGQPDKILGYDYIENEDMPDIAANALPLAFADFREGVTIVDRFGMRVLVDPYTKKGYIRYYFTKRTGMRVSNFKAIKLLKIAVS